jgi:putative component of membrane protein insertase Oxa1/YidC/SpoIIIJ protein YidD
MRFKICFLLIPLFAYTQTGYHQPWGKDADIEYQAPVCEKKNKTSPLATVMKQVIHFHQSVLSPVDGPRSHFKPSSSMYMKEAIDKYGFFKGYLMGCDRLLRENSDAWVYRLQLIENEGWKTNPVP